MGKFDGILICTDLDGTLLKNDKSISKENMNAIEYFKQNGGYFTFITGRMPFFSHEAIDIVKPNCPFGCINGAGVYDHRKNEYVWKTGEMHFMRMTDYHEICLNGNAMVHVVSVRPSMMPTEMLQKIRAIPGDLVTYLPQKEFAHMNALLLLLEEVMAREPLDETMATHLLHVILTLFLRNFQREEVRTQESESMIGAITLYIGEHFRGDLSLDQIAEKFYISKNYLCFYFKKNLGKTVMTYIKDLRLEYAAN